MVKFLSAVNPKEGSIFSIKLWDAITLSVMVSEIIFVCACVLRVRMNPGGK